MFVLDEFSECIEMLKRSCVDRYAEYSPISWYTDKKIDLKKFYVKPYIADFYK